MVYGFHAGIRSCVEEGGLRAQNCSYAGIAVADRKLDRGEHRALSRRLADGQRTRCTELACWSDAGARKTFARLGSRPFRNTFGSCKTGPSGVTETAGEERHARGIGGQTKDGGKNDGEGFHTGVPEIGCTCGRCEGNGWNNTVADEEDRGKRAAGVSDKKASCAGKKENGGCLVGGIQGQAAGNEIAGVERAPERTAERIGEGIGQRATEESLANRSQAFQRLRPQRAGGPHFGGETIGSRGPAVRL